MSRLGRAVRDWTIIGVGTVLVLEAISFSVLVWRQAAEEGVGLLEAAGAQLHRHPFLDRSVERVKDDSEYVFVPTTQYAFRANTTFQGLRVGQHGFILNGDAEPTPFPDKPAGLVRVVILGGSSAAGATATGNDKTIAARLEALLSESGSASYQVLNYGVGGNYSYGELARLITEVAYLDPDVVILFDGFNDAHYANLEHLRAELDAPLMNWADFSYHYFDAMAGLRGAVRAPPPVLTFTYLLVEGLVGRARAGSVREQRQALYDALPARAMSDWVAARDPRFRSVLATNLDIAAAWASRHGVWLFAYLQPHPWEYKDLSCERAAGKQLMIGRLGPALDETRYVELMRAAFQGYAKAYAELDAAYADVARVHFTDLRRLFEDTHGCVYNDAIHYDDDANLVLATRMVRDLVEAGIPGIPRGPAQAPPRPSGPPTP